MVARVINERPKLNRFVQAGRIYERDEITVSFVAKRRFTDHSEEALMVYKAKGGDTLADVSRRIVGEVHEMREQKHAVGLDDIMNKFAKLPRLLLMFIVRVVRWLDYWGKRCPSSLRRATATTPRCSSPTWAALSAPPSTIT